MDFGIGGIFGLVILILDVWAIVNIAQSGASTGHKVLWRCTKVPGQGLYCDGECIGRNEDCVLPT